MTSSFGADSPPELPAPLAEALARSAALGPVTVEWSQVAQKAPDAPEFRTPMPAPLFFATHKRRFAYSGGKFFSWSEGATQHEGKVVPSHTEFAFDGKVLYGGSPDTKSGRTSVFPSLIKTKNEKVDDPTKYANFEYFNAASINLFIKGSSPPVVSAEPVAVQYLRRGGQLLSAAPATLDGVPVVRVEVAHTSPYWEAVQSAPAGQKQGNPARLADLERLKSLPQFQHYVVFLDPALGYGARQAEERYPDGKLLTRWVCKNFKQVGDRGVWLPHHCTVEYHYAPATPWAISDKVVWQRVFAVSKVDHSSIPDQQFALNYDRPGTMVSDGTLPEAEGKPGGTVNYVIPARQEDLDRVIQEARGNPPATHSIVLRALAAVLAVAVLAVAFYAFRRRQQVSAP